ncbi:MAG: hypothetical protein ACOCQD_05530 [archaeon]
MAIKRDKTVCDIIPVFENGDVKRVYDHGLVKFNQIILGVFNQLQMFKGTLEEYPEMGCMDSLLNIYFSESQLTMIDEIKENFNKFQDQNINIDIVKGDRDDKSVNIIITVDNIPNFKFTADLIKNNQLVKIVNPQVLEV